MLQVNGYNSMRLDLTKSEIWLLRRAMEEYDPVDPNEKVSADIMRNWLVTILLLYDAIGEMDVPEMVAFVSEHERITAPWRDPMPEDYDD